MSLTHTLQQLHIAQLSAMQQEAYKAITTTDKDVVVLSPTGSGKTLAYLLPLTELINSESEAVEAIVVVPGRELALQSAEVLKSMNTGLRTTACYGGRTAMEEHKTLRQIQPQIVFGTPGRLNDHISKGNISAYGVRYIIIDEFDKCLEMGFHDEMARLLKSLPGVKRRFLLSATDANEIPNFIRLNRAIKVDFTNEQQVSNKIELYEVKSETKDKLETLSKLLCTLGNQQSIVFLNYRDSVERTAQWLREKGFGVSSFHGGMDQKMREDALYKFSNGSANVFVSTDLGSRGLDIPGVNNIIHYHLPLNEDGYIHRVGRTARWDACGRAFFILGPEEHKPEFIEADFQPFTLPDAIPEPPLPKMATIYIGKGKKDKISKGDILGFLCKIGKIKASEIGRIDVKDRYAYVAIDNNKINKVLVNTRGEKIKGIKTIVEPVK